MGIHVLNKGKAGEREAIKFLQPTINKVYGAMGLEPIALFRNQNQSALGGYDIDGLPWIALEIKRQEALNFNAWWKQVSKAASADQVRVVMFRQNHKKWRFLMPVWLHTGGTGHFEVRGEVTKEDFLEWFEQSLIYHINRESENTNE